MHPIMTCIIFKTFMEYCLINILFNEIRYKICCRLIYRMYPKLLISICMWFLKNAVKDVANSTGSRTSNYKSNGFIYD